MRRHLMILTRGPVGGVCGAAWVLSLVLVGMGVAAAQGPGPAHMAPDRYTVVQYDNGGLVMLSSGLQRTVRAEVVPAQCEAIARNTVVEVLTETQGFGFWMERTFCRITRVEER